MTEVPLSEARVGDLIAFKRGKPREILLVDGGFLYLPSFTRPRDAVVYHRAKLRQRGITHALRPTVCAWCEPGGGDANTSHGICAEHRREVFGGEGKVK